MQYRPSVPAVMSSIEYWGAEINKWEKAKETAEQDLIKMGWDTNTPAQTIHDKVLELRQIRKRWGHAKHRLSQALKEEEMLRDRK